jgi:hypothetical protein
MNMASPIRFTCTALAGSNKQGLSKVDENGYYEQCVGGLNIFNSVGQFYVYEQARELFERSSHFMRRIQRGVIGSELGHPKLLPGMSERMYMQRLAQIYENNVCAFIQDITLDFDNYKDDQGRSIIGIIAKLKPDGPHGPSLESAFKDPKQNVCFSIRSFTEDYEDRGITKRILREIITFDRVTEPGLNIAEKFKTPSLEALVDFGVSAQQMKRAYDSPNIGGGVGMESFVFDPKVLIKTLGMEVRRDAKNVPEWMNW